jgi:hypothetical protein
MQGLPSGPLNPAPQLKEAKHPIKRSQNKDDRNHHGGYSDPLQLAQQLPCLLVIHVSWQAWFPS